MQKKTRLDSNPMFPSAPTLVSPPQNQVERTEKRRERVLIKKKRKRRKERMRKRRMVRREKRMSIVTIRRQQHIHDKPTQNQTAIELSVCMPDRLCVAVWNIMRPLSTFDFLLFCCNFACCAICLCLDDARKPMAIVW